MNFKHLLLPVIGLITLGGCAASSDSPTSASGESDYIASCLTGKPLLTITCALTSPDHKHTATITALKSTLVPNPNSVRPCAGPTSTPPTSEETHLFVYDAAGAFDSVHSVILQPHDAVDFVTLTEGAERLLEHPFVFSDRHITGAITLVSDAAGTVHVESDYVEVTDPNAPVSFEGTFACTVKR